MAARRERPVLGQGFFPEIPCALDLGARQAELDREGYVVFDSGLGERHLAKHRELCEELHEDAEEIFQRLDAEGTVDLGDGRRRQVHTKVGPSFRRYFGPILRAHRTRPRRSVYLIRLAGAERQDVHDHATSGYFVILALDDGYTFHLVPRSHERAVYDVRELQELTLAAGEGVLCRATLKHCGGAGTPHGDVRGLYLHLAEVNNLKRRGHRRAAAVRVAGDQGRHLRRAPRRKPGYLTESEDEETGWCHKGAYVKERRSDRRYGFATMKPDRDGEVKVKWTDGTTSGYLDAKGLELCLTAAQVKWCKDRAFCKDATDGETYMINAHPSNYEPSDGEAVRQVPGLKTPARPTYCVAVMNKSGEIEWPEARHLVQVTPPASERREFEASRAQWDRRRAETDRRIAAGIDWVRKGAFAVFRADRERFGEVTMDIDGDGDVKVRLLPSGEDSGYVKATALRRADRADLQRAGKWCKPGSYGRVDGRVGTITSAGVDSDGDVKLRWRDDGTTSGWVKAIRIQPLSPAEVAGEAVLIKEAVQAAAAKEVADAKARAEKEVKAAQAKAKKEKKAAEARSKQLQEEYAEQLAALQAGREPEVEEHRPSPELHRAALKGNVYKIREILSRPGTNVDEVDADGETALMCAAQAGRVSAVQALIQGGANVHFQHAEAQFTALHAAANNGDFPDIVRQLLDAGADKDAKDMWGLTALQGAEAQHFAATVALLTPAAAGADAGAGLADAMNAIGLSRYTELMAAQGLTVDQLGSLDHAMLEALGMRKLGDRLKFIAHFANAGGAGAAGQADVATPPAEGVPAGLRLQQGRETIDFVGPPLGGGSVADARRGTYQFSLQASPVQVAFKIFRGGAALPAEIRDKISHELRIGAQLKHANLIRIYGVLELDGHGPALVLELANGGSLRNVLSDRTTFPSLPWSRRIVWLTGIADGMAELHNLLPRGIIHRDLKAANVLLSHPDIATATAKVCDFGISMALEAVRASQTGGSAGTLAWKAPETFSGHYSNASDVFSFAVVCFEVLSRAIPWSGLGQPEVFAKANARFEVNEMLLPHGITQEMQLAMWHQSNPLNERRPDLGLCEAGCPSELQELVTACWADDRDARPSFSDCAERLKHIRPAHDFGSSNFKREYEVQALPVTLATEVFALVSTFLRCYCRVHGLNEDGHQVLLEEFILGLQRQTAQHAGVDVLDRAGPTAELLWTSPNKFRGVPPAHNKELCSLINAALRADHPELAAATAGVCRAINTLCVTRANPVAAAFPPQGTTYRGTAFRDADREFFAVGKQYRVPGFLATSFSLAVAERFRAAASLPAPFGAGGSRMLWVVHVDPAGEQDPARRCAHVNLVSNTHVDGEQEFLFAPYSIFTVRAVAWGADGMHRVELDAATDNVTGNGLDGRWATPASCDELPLAPWY